MNNKFWKLEKCSVAVDGLFNTAYRIRNVCLAVIHSFVSQIFHSKKNSARCDHTCTYVFVWRTGYSCKILIIFELYRHILEKFSNIEFYKKSVQLEHRRMDRQTDMTQYVFMWRTGYSCQILITLELYRNIFENFSNIEFYKNPYSWSTDGWTDRQTDMTQLIVDVRSSANAPKKL